MEAVLSPANLQWARRRVKFNPGAPGIDGPIEGHWSLSRTKATQTGMTNDWWKAQALVSMRARKAQGYA